MYTTYQQQSMGGGRSDFMAHQAAPSSFDRKRGFDDLNDFFGALKRRQVNPADYASIGRSLVPIHSTPLGMHAGGGGGLAAEYMAPVAQLPALSIGGGGAGPQGPHTQHYYLPPMPNLRTKDDLRDIDHILQQMQATVYENTGSPDSNHYSGMDMRHHSPAYATRPTIDPYPVTAAQVNSPLGSVASSASTPSAVTPSSSNMSYTSGHSPSASSAGLSPTSRHSSTSINYPNLPAIAHPQSNLSALGTSFTSTERRLSGGLLQSASAAARASEAADRAAADAEDRATTPRGGGESARSSVSSPSTESDSGEAPETYDSWIHNMRLLETLRKAIQERLETREYDDASDDSRIDPMVLDSPRPRNAEGQTRPEKPLYPALPVWS